jgi:hypothetical protein
LQNSKKAIRRMHQWSAGAATPLEITLIVRLVNNIVPR